MSLLLEILLFTLYSLGFFFVAYLEYWIATKKNLALINRDVEGFANWVTWEGILVWAVLIVFISSGSNVFYAVCSVLGGRLGAKVTLRKEILRETKGLPSII